MHLLGPIRQLRSQTGPSQTLISDKEEVRCTDYYLHSDLNMRHISALLANHPVSDFEILILRIVKDQNIGIAHPP